MFSDSQLRTCIDEAERFIARAKQVMKDNNEYIRQNTSFQAKGGYNAKEYVERPFVPQATRNSGACRRASLDLSSALAKLRRSGE